MKKGFTLLEVLVAATIISLLSGISLVGYNRFQERQQLAAAKDQLRNDLRQTQQKALAGEKPAGWCSGSGKTLTGWRLEFVTTSAYQIQAVCSDGSTAVDKVVNLPAGVSKSAGNDFADFASITGSSSDYLFTVRFGAASGIWEGTVSVTTAGLVQSSAIAATTSTPAPTGGALSTSTPIPTPTPLPTATPMPTPTPPPTPTPVPTPVPSWQYVGRFDSWCNSSRGVSFQARAVRMTMVGGGGGDCRISFNCCGSGGASWTGSGTLPAPWTFATNCGDTVQTQDSGTVYNISTQYISVGCNDGESGTYDIYRYGP